MKLKFFVQMVYPVRSVGVNRRSCTALIHKKLGRSDRKHLNLRARGKFFTSAEIFSGLSGMRAFTTVIYRVSCICLARRTASDQENAFCSTRRIITCADATLFVGGMSASQQEIYPQRFTSSLLQESPHTKYRFRRIVAVVPPAYSQPMNVALNFPTFRAGAGA